MNRFTTQISDRLLYNDPLVTELSTRRFPLTTITSEEVAVIVKSLQHNTVVKSVDIAIPSIPNDWNDTDTTAVENNENIPRDSGGWSSECLYDMICANSTIASLSIHDIKTDDIWLALSNGMKTNTSIRDLTLGNASNIWSMELSVTACQCLKTILIHGRNLQCLRLKSFTIPRKESTEEVCTGLGKCLYLRELVLHSIECDYMELIFAAIARSKSQIQKLTFIDCNMEYEYNEMNNNEESNPLIMMLSNASSCTLQELRINECMITSDVVRALCKGIAQNSSLELLDLSGCDLLSVVGKSLSNVLRTNKSLLHLSLEENILGDQGVMFLAAGLKMNSTLQSLDLRANNISECGCEHIAESLKVRCCKLRLLTLSDNPINDSGATFLGSALGENKSLEMLDLHATMIGDEGLQFLCQGLASNTSVKEINLSNNWCKRGHHISSMLSYNTVLESIDISSCHISDDTLEQLLKSLSEGTNTSLKSLYISFNAFTNRGAFAIARMLSGRNKLEILSAQYNAFDCGGLRTIATALSTNYYLNSFYYWNGQLSTNHEMVVIDEIDHYLNLNRAGRRAILENRSGTAIWAKIIKGSDLAYGPSSVFHLLREMPAIMNRV